MTHSEHIQFDLQSKQKYEITSSLCSWQKNFEDSGFEEIYDFVESRAETLLNDLFSFSWHFEFLFETVYY